MKNIKYFAIADDASSWYRIQGVLPYINHPELTLESIQNINVGSWASYIKTDVLIIQRAFNIHHVGYIYQAKIMGIKVILDYDDDVLNIPDHNPAHGTYVENRQYVLDSLRMVDEIWVSTEAIKESFLPYNKNIHVIPNAHNDFVFKVENKKPFNFKNKKVFYRGGDTHRMDLHEHCEDLVNIAHNNPDWKFMYMGVLGNEEFFRANIKNLNVSVTSKLPFIQYMDYICNLNAMVAICPLEIHKLNQAKSNCSWLESTYAGSCFFGKKSLPEFNKPFILPFSLFGKAIEENHITTMKKHNEESWQFICDNLLLSNVNKKRIERLTI